MLVDGARLSTDNAEVLQAFLSNEVLEVAWEHHGGAAEDDEEEAEPKPDVKAPKRVKIKVSPFFSQAISLFSNIQ